MKPATFLKIGLALVGAGFICAVLFLPARGDISNPHPTPPSNSVTNAMLTATAVGNNVVDSANPIAASKIATSTTQDFISPSGGTIKGIQTFSQVPVYNGADPTSSTQFATISYINNNVAANTATFIANANIANRSPVYIITAPAANANVFNNATADQAGCFFGKNSFVAPTNDATFCAQQFTASSTATLASIDVAIATVVSPTDHPQISIRPDNSGNPSSTVLGSATTSLSNLGAYTTYAIVNMTGTITGVSLTSGQKYWVVFGRDGATDANNRYAANGTSTLLNATSSQTGNGTSWAATSPVDTLYFKLYTQGGTAADNAFNGAGATSSFMGFANATATAGANVTVQTFGLMSGFNSLSTGLDYWLTSATNTVTSTASASSLKVGLATASGSLLILHNN